MKKVRVVIPLENRVWALQKKKTGQWELPGGIVERGESVEEAAIREVFEEIGTTIILDTYAGYFNGCGQGRNTFTHIYGASIVRGVPILREEKFSSIDLVNPLEHDLFPFENSSFNAYVRFIHHLKIHE